MAVAASSLEDWRDKKSLPECIMYMLQNEIMCDVSFRVGQDRRLIKAHKFMLSSRSPVFYTMFEGSLPETGEIDVPDVDEKTFNTMLEFIYSDELKLSNENVKDVLYVADKYMLDKAKKACSELLKQTACSVNAAVALLTSKQFSLEDLQRASLQYIENNSKQCLSSEHTLNLTKECTKLILESDCLSCTETDVCKFFISWLEKQCSTSNEEKTGENLRKYAEALLPLVRFPLVDKEYFSKEVSHKGLLTLQEIVSVFRSHYGENSEYFSKNSRIPPKTRPIITITRQNKSRSTWKERGTEALVFQSDKNFWIRGIVIFGPVGDTPTSKRPFISELLDQTEKKIFSKVFNLSSSATTTEKFSIDPLLVPANQPHTILVKDLKVNTYFGEDCKASVKVNDATITFQNSPLCTTSTNVEQGQIAGFLLST